MEQDMDGKDYDYSMYNNREEEGGMSTKADIHAFHKFWGILSDWIMPQAVDWIWYSWKLVAL
jgi:hypothetical protein